MAIFAKAELKLGEGKEFLSGSTQRNTSPKRKKGVT